jgi:hypothetical protein
MTGLATGDPPWVTRIRAHPLLPLQQSRGGEREDDRVSLTIDHDTPDVIATTGLSMAAAHPQSGG